MSVARRCKENSRAYRSSSSSSSSSSAVSARPPARGSCLQRQEIRGRKERAAVLPTRRDVPGLDAQGGLVGDTREVESELVLQRLRCLWQAAQRLQRLHQPRQPAPHPAPLLLRCHPRRRCAHQLRAPGSRQAGERTRHAKGSRAPIFPATHLSVPTPWFGSIEERREREKVRVRVCV